LQRHVLRLNGGLGVNRYRPAKQGSGPRAGQLLQHVTDPKRWLVKAFIGRDAKGRKRYRSRVVHGGRRDADAVLLEMLQQKSTGSLAPRSNMTLAELVKEWETHKARQVAPRTLTQYVYVLGRYVLPSLGRKKLANLTLHDIDRLYGQMLTGEIPDPNEDRASLGSGLSAGTVRLTHKALSQALSQAVRWGWIQVNPAGEASLPTHRPKAKVTLSAAERARLIVACRDSFYGCFYHLLVDTGLRPGEACALRWDDVDFARDLVVVRCAVTRGATGEPIMADPKTPKSRRVVPILSGLREALLRHQAWQRECNLDVEGLVFTNQDGRPIRPWTFSTRDLKRTLQAAGIAKRLSPYSLRHTFATLHVDASTSLKRVSDLLGHSTIKQTADTYMHADQAVSRDWIDQYERMLRAGEAEAERPLN